MKKILVLLCVSLMTLSSSAITKDESNFFEKKIRPVLIKECYKCHSAEGKKAKGQLLLDNRDSSLKGGETGPAVIPNDVEQSLLIKAIRYLDKDLQMPPDGKLSPQIIADFETWIKNGAADPRTEKVKVVDFNKESKEHWAYKPLTSTEVPKSFSKWVSNPIDNFVISELTKTNLMPSQIADKKILIRRAYFDLIGLPPTEKEVELFVADKSTDAYKKLIDRLLENPMYGERWGRHWLDTARYSDTSGTVNGNREPRYTYSYTYRDYVIRSFNENKPFDRFIIEQIAGDTMSDIKRVDLAGLGFLTLGKNSGNANDVIDDQIDVIFKGFMATTVVCARCHDHKFDPITTKDYYALHGVLNSSYFPSDNEKPLLSPVSDDDGYKDYLIKRSVIETEIENFIKNRHVAALNEFKTNTFKNVYGGYALNSVASSNRTDYIRESGLNIRMIQRWTQSNSKGGKKTATLESQRSTFLPLTLMFNVPELTFKEEFTSMMDKNSTNINPYLAQHIKKVGVIKNMKDLAASYHNAVLAINTTPTNIVGSVEFAAAIFQNGGPLDIDRDSFSRFYASNQKTMQYDNELRQQRGKLITHEIAHPSTPARAMALGDKPRATESPVLIKGDPGTRGPIVARRFITTFDYLNPNIFTNGSGRLELAKSIANPLNPLTPRVIVNRIWQFHFGEGLVTSSDDFGINTPKPVHYDLLNYLSSRFIKEGWSVKDMHRLIMTSSTYCQLSNGDGRKALVDPYNRLYWRMNNSRLDFETLRDTLLYLGGKLDSKMGGQSVNLITANSGEYSTRRTVYGLVDRGRLPEVFTTFDFATPEMTTGRRFQTTVPKQALFLMNNSMVIEQVRNMITRPEFLRIVSEEERIKALYRVCFQRDPSELEIKIGIRYMENAMREDMSDVKKEYNWKYGYRAIGPNRTLSKFFEFPSFDKEVYSSTNIFFKGVSATRNGGSLSSNQDIYSIRQWISPRNGSILISGTVSVKVKSQSASLVLYKNGSPIKTVIVAGGPEISFSQTMDVGVDDKVEFSMVNTSLNNKDYTLAIKILEVKDVNSLTPVTWASNVDFRGPIKKSDRELNSWERYTHILILSNEMVFVN
jgi:cytochrome c553